MKINKQLLCFTLAAIYAGSVGCGKKNVRTHEETGNGSDNSAVVSDISGDTTDESESDDICTPDDSKAPDNNKTNNDGEEDSAVSETPTQKPEVRAPDGGDPITVSINTPEGEYVTEYGTHQEIDLNRPSNLSEELVFTGWKEQKTLNRIEGGEPASGDILILTPETADIGGRKNAIYNNAVYAHTGQEFTVPVRVGGDTELCVLDLSISYDPSVMEFVRFENTDGDAAINCKQEEHKILISFVTTKNITSDTLLTDIVFRPVSEEHISSQLTYTVTDIASWNSSKKELADTEYGITAGDIVMY